MTPSQTFMPLSELEREVFSRSVPADAFLRRLTPLLDFERFRSPLAQHYGADFGRPSLGSGYDAEARSAEHAFSLVRPRAHAARSSQQVGTLVREPGLADQAPPPYLDDLLSPARRPRCHSGDL